MTAEDLYKEAAARGGRKDYVFCSFSLSGRERAASLPPNCGLSRKGMFVFSEVVYNGAEREHGARVRSSLPRTYCNRRRGSAHSFVFVFVRSTTASRVGLC